MNKPLLLTTLLLLVLALAGCSQGTIEPTEEETSRQGVLTQEEAAQEEVTTAPSLDEEVTDALAKQERVKSLKYTYYDSDHGKQGDHYAVLGDKMRVENFIPQTYHKEDLHTVVFIDREVNTQVGYCRDEVRCKDIDPDKHIAPMEDYDRRTPFDWADLIKRGKLINTETIDGRTALKVATTIDGEETLIWIDSYYGIPMKVQQGDFTITFDELAFNTVKSEEVNP